MGTYMCLDKPCMGTLLFTCMLVGAWRCPTPHGHTAFHGHVGRIMEVPRLTWAQGSSRACCQGSWGALPRMGTWLFTCMLAEAGRCPASPGHTVLHVPVGREHGGARSGPCTSIHIFAHSYYLRRPMMLVLLPLRLTVCLMPLYKEGLTVTSQLVVCLQLFP